MDGFTYENPSGGWQMCDICSARVTNPQKHAVWHRSLTTAISHAFQGVWRGDGWNEVPRG